MNIFNSATSHRRSALGFTIIELLIVLAITSIAAIIGAQKVKAYFLDQQAQQRADVISVLGKATANYIAKKRTTFTATGFSDITLLQTLRDDGNLSPNFGSAAAGASPSAMGYAIRIYSNCATTPCAITAWVYSTSAWVVDGKVRIDLVGSAVRKIGLPGGMNYNTVAPLPGYVNGAVGNGGPGNWTLSAAAYPAAAGFPYSAGGGQLFYNASIVPLDDGSFLRVDGTNKMNGSLNMGAAGAGQNILMNAGNIVNANGITTATATATGDLMGGSLTTTGQTPVVGNVTAGSAVTAGTTVTAVGDVMGSSITTTGQTPVTGNVTAGNGVTAGTTVRAAGDVMGASITTAGMTAVPGNVTAGNDVTIDSLRTRDAGAPALTTSLKTLAPRLVEMFNYTIDTATGPANGAQIPVPNCAGVAGQPSGTPNIFVIPQKEVGTADNGKYGSVSKAFPVAPAAGTFWTLSITDSQIVFPATVGSPIPSTSVPHYAAVVRTFCAY